VPDERNLHSYLRSIVNGLLDLKLGCGGRATKLGGDGGFGDGTCALALGAADATGGAAEATSAAGATTGAATGSTTGGALTLAAGETGAVWEAISTAGGSERR
jgi:hypothetical protein